MMTRGTRAAAVTPLGRQGDIDFGAVFELIDYLGAAGVQGIVLFGSAGEYPALDHAERARLIYLAVKRSRVPIWIGAGSASLDRSIALAREALNAGAEVLLPPPYFYRYRQEDLIDFYRHFAEHVGEGTVWLADTPEVSSGMAPATALDLLSTGLYAGVAEAGTDVEAFRCLEAAAARLGFGLLAANDATLVETRFGNGEKREVHGCISESACAVPELIVALDRAMEAADRPRISRLEAMLREFLGWVSRFPRPALLKVATQLRGLKTGPPAVPLSSARQPMVDEFREWFEAWLPVARRIAADA